MTNSFQALMATTPDAEQSDIFKALTEATLDITGATMVEVQARKDGTVLWVNVNGICVLRICRIQHLTIDDAREDR